MTHLTGEYYSMNSGRLHGIAALCQLREPAITVRQVCDICLDTDWPEGTLHQDWLDNAPSVEIAEWVIGIYQDVQEAQL